MKPYYPNLLMTDAGGGPGVALPEEPVYTNLFEIAFVLPVILQAQKRNALLLLQEATSIDLDTSPKIEFEEQRFKYSTRVYVKTPKQTHIEFDIEFNVNVNDAGSMESYDTLKAWYDLVWNSQNGSLHYKKDIIGTVIVQQSDRVGYILRRTAMQNTQILSVDKISLSWEDSKIWKTKCSFVADYFIDEIRDSNFAIGGGDYLQGYP